MRCRFSYVVSFAIGVILTSIVFAIFRRDRIVEVEKPIIKTEYITKTDTITKTIYKPQYITETLVRTDTIINNNDSITLPITSRSYNIEISNDNVDGEIFANVSGFNPSLDSINYQFRVKNQIQKITETRIRQKRWGFSVGVGVGYGLTTRKADIFVGGIVGYSF